MNPQISFLLNKALESLRNSSLNSAELYLKQAMRLQSNNPHVLRLLGVICAQRKQYSEALNYLNKSIKHFPKNSLALSNIGNVFLALKEYDNALDAYNKSIKLDSKYEEAWSNMGNVLYELKRYEEAIDHYDRAIRLKPDYAEAWSNKGNSLRALKRYEEAIDHYDRAIGLKPDYAEAWSNKGNSLRALKRYEEAIDHYDRAIGLKPDDADIWANKGNTLRALKRYDEAIDHYDRALSLKPNTATFFYQKGSINMDFHRYESAIENLEDAIRNNYQPVSHAKYLLSALRPQNGLKPMPHDFVADLFNEYADHFDGHLVGALKYNAPEFMFSLLNLRAGNKFEILDIGCGTGLMGKLLEPFTSRMVGVDLSQDMLSRAESTGVYDELLVADVLEFLDECKESFNLVVAADVFIYIGELKNIFKDLSRIIPAGGLFCFSIEKSEAASFSLSPKTLRYSHSREYIQELASLNNFKIKNFLEGSIRQEHEIGVIGICFLLEKF